MKALVVYSGGMDSTVLLYWAKQMYNEVEAISFNYGQKHSKELEYADLNCTKLGIKHTIIDLKEVVGKHFKSSLLRGQGDIPEGHYEDESMKVTVVPFRNGIMLSIAIGYAESIGAKEVCLGSHAGDHAIYPDCRPEFTKAIREAAYTGTYNQIVIRTPFNTSTKGEIAKLGNNLGVDFDQTWSCYKGEDTYCGKCGTCVERIEALEWADKQ